MRSGELDRLVHVQHATITRDSVGGHVQTWATIGTVWAKVASMRGSTLFNAKAAGSSVSLVITIRFNSTVLPNMRLILDDGMVALISHILPIGRREKMELYCEAVA